MGVGGRESVAGAAWSWGWAGDAQVSSWCAKDLENNKQGSGADTS